MSLDNKLKKILDSVNIHEYAEEKTIAQIKQAFADEGYVHVPQVQVVTRYERGKKPEVYMVNGKKVMTGQEFYDRFEKELKTRLEKIPYEGGATIEIHWEHLEVLEAARKAAGL